MMTRVLEIKGTDIRVEIEGCAGCPLNFAVIGSFDKPRPVACHVCHNALTADEIIWLIERDMWTGFMSPCPLPEKAAKLL